MTDAAKMIEQINGSGFTIRSIADHIGVSQSLIYKLSSMETVKLSPSVWERLKALHGRLTTAGVIK